MLEHETINRLSIGISGLDEVLNGGVISGRTYLVRGGPGTGKTIMGLHFLTARASAGEGVLLISLGEAASQLRANAKFFVFSPTGGRPY